MLKNRIIIISVFAISVLGFIFLSESLAFRNKSGSQTLESMDLKPKINENSVYLYFAEKDNSSLKAEKRLIHVSGSPESYGRTIVENLISGSLEGLMRTIPESTDLRAFYIAADGTGYADFSPEIREKHPGGISMELLTIYSIVNSLILNIPEIDRLKILIGGMESLTLAGHIDIRAPLIPDMLFVK